MPAPEPTISPLRDLQFRAEYVLLRVIVGFVKLFPLETAASISAKTWRVFAPYIASKRHNRALDNIAIAFPDMPSEERLRIVRCHWENLGREKLA